MSCFTESPAGQAIVDRCYFYRMIFLVVVNYLFAYHTCFRNVQLPHLMQIQPHSSEILRTQIKTAIIFVCVYWYSTVSLINISSARNPSGKWAPPLPGSVLLVCSCIGFLCFILSVWSEQEIPSDCSHGAIARDSIAYSRIFRHCRCPFPSIWMRRLVGSLLLHWTHWISIG